jgi:hypothetical protein
MRKVTIPICPNCGNSQSAIFSWGNMKWYCFDCDAVGTVEVSYTVDVASDPSPLMVGEEPDE